MPKRVEHHSNATAQSRASSHHGAHSHLYARIGRLPQAGSHLSKLNNHVIPRSQGGPHTENNLISICGSHHRLLHDGRLAIQHRTPTILDVTFPDGRRGVIRLDGEP